MGASSSKSASKRYGNVGTREFLSASMSVNLPRHNGTSVAPGQTERASFMNHPIYLPSVAISQKHQHGANFVSSRQHDLEPYSPGADYLALDAEQHPADYNHRHPQKRRLRAERQELLTRSVALEREQAPDSRLKGALLASAAPGRRRERLAPGASGSGGANDALDTGGSKEPTKRGELLASPARRRLLPVQAQAFTRSPPSSSLSRSQSLGSRSDLCYCAECCSLEGEQATPEQCYCSSAMSSATGEGAERNEESERVRGAAFGAPTNERHHDATASRQHFPPARLARLAQLQSQELALQQFQQLGPAALQLQAPQPHIAQYRNEARSADNDNNNIATNEALEYRVAGSHHHHRHHHQPAPARRRKRRSKDSGALLVGRDERGELGGEIVALSEIPTTAANSSNHDNDEATTCSAGSSSDLQQPRRHLSPLTVSIASNLISSGTRHHHKLHHRASSQARTRTSAKTTTTSKSKNNNMTSVAQTHSHDGAGKQINGVASVPAYKKSSLERGLAMDDDARKRHGLLGLLPAAVQDQAMQSRAVINFIDNCKDELSKYVYLRHLKDFNEKLFYYTLVNNVQRLMPLVYTPTVGLACQKFSEVYMRPRGLFVTAKDAGRVRQIIANWPEKDVRVIVVTDGERILGLGDLGANGMGISIGKLSLYTALAGIPPQNVLPVTIDVGTENETFLKDPFYIGLRQRRVRGDQYEALVEEFMQAVVERWGRSCLIQFEDFANAAAFNLLQKYRNHYCTFNDDIQGTASVCLSGLISAAKVTGKRLSDCSFLFYGAGEANLGTAQLLIAAMVEDGLKSEEARTRIWLVDSKGLVVSSRQDLSGHKREFARDAQPVQQLEAIIDLTKPTAIVGASAQAGSFTESICRKMASYTERPIIFALSNPTSKAECTAEQAYRWTEGKCVYASGSPFEPVQFGGKTYVTGQGNNAYIFPGVGLAAIGAHTHTIPNEVFLVAARALSDQLTSQDTQVGLVYPRLDRIREVTLKVAARVLEFLFAERLATYRPEPSDKLEFLRGIQYDPSY